MIGEMIKDRYVIESVIGKGSSATVYKATRLMMGGVVAIKIVESYLGADPNTLDRLLRELKASEKLSHSNVITVWESGVTDDGQPFLVMDFVEGITLSDLIKRDGVLPTERSLNIIKQVIGALGHAHEKGLIHRDIKPENVVLEQNERSGDFAKVLDFGIAATAQETASLARFNKPNTVAGSPAYMSPEQCQGFDLDFRSDLYSVAVMIFEMFTGRRPFIGRDITKLMYKTVTEMPPTMGQVSANIEFPREVEAVVAKALSKNPDDRQTSMKQLWDELSAACASGEFKQKENQPTLFERSPMQQKPTELPEPASTFRSESVQSEPSKTLIEPAVSQGAEQQKPTPPGQQKPTPPGHQTPSQPEHQMPTPPGHQMPTPPGHQTPSAPAQQMPTPPGHQTPSQPEHQMPTPPGHQTPKPPARQVLPPAPPSKMIAPPSKSGTGARKVGPPPMPKAKNQEQ